MDGMMSVLFSVQKIFREFDMTCRTACAKYNDLAMNSRAEVVYILDTTDTSNLRGSFRRALSLSIPPLTLYRNYRPGGYSNLIFGVPLVAALDHSIIEGNVPKVMRMCMEEIEKRGFNIAGLYTVSLSRR